jgi:glycosyltransferase involved in cell wall biosynthesis
MVDIVMVTFNRVDFTKQAIDHLESRTRTPFRLIVVDNGSTDETPDYLCGEHVVGNRIFLSENMGIHYAWNKGLSTVISRYFVTTDNDILCPSLDPDWLGQLVEIMDRHPEYGAIALRPQVMVGERGDIFDEADEVLEHPRAGASLRIMRTRLVKSFGGWEHVIRPGRDHEERWIASRMHERGYKVGYVKNLRCFHLFGENWGYGDIPMKVHGHNPIWPLPECYDRIKCDPETWVPL